MAIGDSANTTGTNSTSIGNGSFSTGANSVAVGDGAGVSGNNAVAIGRSANASGINAVAEGYAATATADGAVALGVSADSQGSGAAAIGVHAAAMTDNSIAIGSFSRVDAPAVWQANHSYSTYDVVQDPNSNYSFICQSPGNSGSSVPAWVKYIGASTSDGPLTWQCLEATNAYDLAVSIGNYARAVQQGAISIGDESLAAQYAITLGYQATSGAASVAIGYRAYAMAYDGVAIGENATVHTGTGNGYGNTAIGYNSEAGGDVSRCTALGALAVNRISDSYVITGLSLVRKDNGENAAQANRYFTGAQSIVFSAEISLKTLLNDAVSFAIPAGATFFPDELGLVITSSSGVTGNPSVSFGVTGNTTSLLASTAVTATAAKNRTTFAPLSKNGVNSLTASVKTAATGTILLGRFYAKGILVEDE